MSERDGIGIFVHESREQQIVGRRRVGILGSETAKRGLGDRHPQGLHRKDTKLGRLPLLPGRAMERGRGAAIAERGQGRRDLGMGFAGNHVGWSSGLVSSFPE